MNWGSHVLSTGLGEIYKQNPQIFFVLEDMSINIENTGTESQ